MRRGLRIAVVVLAFGLVAAPAHAVYLVGPHGVRLAASDPMQRWAEHMRVATWRGPILYVGKHIVSLCGGFDGCALQQIAPSNPLACGYNPIQGEVCTALHAPGQPAEIIVCRPGSRDCSGPRGVLYHELGHQFDFRYLTDNDRRVFARWMAHDLHHPIEPWEEGDASNHWNGAQDDFAEFYTDCAVGMTWLVPYDGRICMRVNAIGRAAHASPPKRRHRHTCSTRTTGPGPTTCGRWPSRYPRKPGTGR